MIGIRKSEQWFLDEWRTFSIILMGILFIVIVILYHPVIDAPFQGDDFRYVWYLFFYFPDLLDGQRWENWLSTFSGFGAWSYFRPVFQLSYLYDYLVWGLNPLGYHLTSLALHLLAAFSSFLLSWLLTHRRRVACVAGLLFAVMPIHVEAVSWFGARADVLVALAYVMSILFFILFSKSHRILFLAASSVAFVLALLAKESSVTLPLILLIYDWLYERKALLCLKRMYTHLLFCGFLVVYLAVRILLWDMTGMSPVPRSPQFPWDHFSQAYLLALVDPLLVDMSNEIRWIILGVVGVLLFVYRSRREVWLAVAWLIITILPSLFSLDADVFDRYVYLPSVGLGILLASVIADPLSSLIGRSYRVAIVLCLVVLALYANGLHTRNTAWARAAQITQLVTQQVLSLHPALPPDARLIFTNVPVLVGARNMQAFGGKLLGSLGIAVMPTRSSGHEMW
ncbi:MAG: hypothetical protein FJ009_15770 [Chloroflexi bacterium]|nr:hypothetical protein [Chloroflexota bacterium]